LTPAFREEERAGEQALADPGEASGDAVALARELGISITAADILHRRGFGADDRTHRFLDPLLGHLTPPDAMADRQAAADRIAFAIRNGETICVFGDYDCDGITSAAITTGMVRALGGTVAPLLATRVEGAYGLSDPALARVLDARPRLLVTCDCGSSDHERLERAGRAGIDAVVIDHHLVPAEPLPVVAFLNPHRPDCGFAEKGLASCGLALSIGAALRKTLGKEIDLRAWLDLVAIGTIADVAPLTGDNRALVRAGLRALSAGRRPGLRALAGLAKLDLSRGVTSEDVAFRIAPRLNAPGRLGHPDDALALLLTDDPERAAGLAATIEQVTLERRAVQATMLDEALRDIEDGSFADASALCLGRSGWHPGVVGIVAGRLADTFQKPTIVVGIEGGRGRGSVRGPAGFPLYDALCRCRGELVGFGGHQAAAGLEVRPDRLEALRAAWVDACSALEAKSFGRTGHPAQVRLDPRDDPSAVVRDLERLEPFGEKNPAPRILLHDVRIVATSVVKEHLKLELASGAHKLRAIAFSMAHLSPSLAGRSASIIGRLRRDHYRGGEAVEMHVDAVLPGP
jgi:single-stranded-DNA-specific exonuclease